MFSDCFLALGLAVICILSAFGLTWCLLLSFEDFKTLFSDTQRGIRDETPTGPVSNETESVQVWPESNSNTAPIREPDQEKGRGDDTSEGSPIAHKYW